MKDKAALFLAVLFLAAGGFLLLFCSEVSNPADEFIEWGGSYPDY
jgi:hypothetical protein